MIAEPMTLATDWLLAGVCAWLGRRLLRAASGQRSIALLGWCFLATALGAFAGGVSHGFRPYLGELGNVVAWKITVLSIGATALFLVASSATAALAGRSRRVLIGLALLQAVVYWAWMITHDDFLWVILDYAPAMLVVLALQLLQWRRGEPGAPWFVAGLGVSFAGAGIQAAGLAPHPSFNHNDLYHVVQVGGMWLIHRGGMPMRDRR